MRFHSLRAEVLFGLVALALMANGKSPVAAAQLAPPASPSVALSASPTSAQAGQPVTLHLVVDERHIHHVEALGGSSRRPGCYDCKAFSIHDLYRHSHRSGWLGPCQRPSHCHTRAPSGCSPEAFRGRDLVRPAADERSGRAGPGESNPTSCRIAAELNQLEERLLYPSDRTSPCSWRSPRARRLRLDAVQIQIDGQLAATLHLQLQGTRSPAARAACSASTPATSPPASTAIEVFVNGKLANGKDYTYRALRVHESSRSRS